ncbi:MAG: MarR family transcriptional regulator [Marinisporobacter sp.]|jgi:DNA-binding MarR family transcriptional regulator|nr:MarR family transcriptional regulator [Marinisporobacter sp.]
MENKMGFMETYTRIVNKHILNQKIPKDYGVGFLLYPSEIHTIAAIGLNPGINCMNLSKKMGVTRGATSQIINRLESKNLIHKYKKEGNRKEVCVKLNELGFIAYENQKKIGSKFYKNLHKKIEGASQNEIDFLVKIFKELENFVDMRIGDGSKND